MKSLGIEPPRALQLRGSCITRRLRRIAAANRHARHDAAKPRDRNPC
jgi:hypothetical protein